jgi:chloride channel 7
MGAAAGVASAFSAPITGLLFAMEEMSSFWSTALTWQTFVCCILARSVTEIFRSVVASLVHHGSRKKFIGFEFSESALFDVSLSKMKSRR